MENRYGRARVRTLTGEGVYLEESFEKLWQPRAVDYIHPDPAVTGGCLELKKMGDLAQRYSIGMMVFARLLRLATWPPYRRSPRPKPSSRHMAPL